MIRYVALLRGIGPVTHAKMRLKDLAEAIGGDAVSIGNTGNIVLSSDAGEHAVAAQVSAAVKGYGLEIDTFIRTRRQMQMLINASPFPDAQHKHPAALGVCFFHKPPKWPEAYLAYAGPERLCMFSNHLIVDYRGQITGSRLTIEKTIGARMTQRNWSSVLRIAKALDLATP
ncbi:MAG TPA: DUF1697 domain-containing protein [Devosia sp.]|nr:DUF1697 domain-containing protein [Devosia sp.]